MTSCWSSGSRVRRRFARGFDKTKADFFDSLLAKGQSSGE